MAKNKEAKVKMVFEAKENTIAVYFERDGKEIAMNEVEFNLRYNFLVAMAKYFEMMSKIWEEDGKKMLKNKEGKEVSDEKA